MRHPPRRLSESASWSRNIGLLKNHGLLAFSEVALRKVWATPLGIIPESRIMEVIGWWSALADDFRTFLLNRDSFELSLSGA